jgi:hypothetical protein
MLPAYWVFVRGARDLSYMGLNRERHKSVEVWKWKDDRAGRRGADGVRMKLEARGWRLEAGSRRQSQNAEGRKPKAEPAGR